MRGNLLVTYSRPPYPPGPGDDAWPEASQVGGGKPTFQCVGGFWARDAGCWRGTWRQPPGLDVVVGSRWVAGGRSDSRTPSGGSGAFAQPRPVGRRTGPPVG